LIDLIQVAKQRDKQMKAYVFGFITHHLLDRSTHPYIHYRAGYEGSKHQKLEVQIDTLMMEKYHRLKTWKAASYKEIDVGFSIDRKSTRLNSSHVSSSYTVCCLKNKKRYRSQ